MVLRQTLVNLALKLANAFYWFIGASLLRNIFLANYCVVLIQECFFNRLWLSFNRLQNVSIALRDPFCCKTDQASIPSFLQNT